MTTVPGAATRSAAPPEVSTDPPEGWVPVDRRWLGLDRATLAPALVVAAVAILFLVVIPAVDARVSSGTRLSGGQDVALGPTVLVTPPAGWVLTDGLLSGRPTSAGSYPKTAAVRRGAVTVTMVSGDFDGSASALLRKLRSDNEATVSGSKFLGRPYSVRTANGTRGVAQEFRQPGGNGTLVALVLDGTGVELVASGPSGIPDRWVRDVDSLVDSVRRRGGTS